MFASPALGSGGSLLVNAPPKVQVTVSLDMAASQYGFLHPSYGLTTPQQHASQQKGSITTGLPPQRSIQPLMTGTSESRSRSVTQTLGSQTNELPRPLDLSNVGKSPTGQEAPLDLSCNPKKRSHPEQDDDDVVVVNVDRRMQKVPRLQQHQHLTSQQQQQHIKEMALRHGMFLHAQGADMFKKHSQVQPNTTDKTAPAKGAFPRSEDAQYPLSPYMGGGTSKSQVEIQRQMVAVAYSNYLKSSQGNRPTSTSMPQNMSYPSAVVRPQNVAQFKNMLESVPAYHSTHMLKMATHGGETYPVPTNTGRGMGTETPSHSGKHVASNHLSGSVVKTPMHVTPHTTHAERDRSPCLSPRRYSLAGSSHGVGIPIPVTSKQMLQERTYQPHKSLSVPSPSSTAMQANPYKYGPASHYLPARRSTSPKLGIPQEASHKLPLNYYQGERVQTVTRRKANPIHTTIASSSSIGLEARSTAANKAQGWDSEMNSKYARWVELNTEKKRYTTQAKQAQLRLQSTSTSIPIQKIPHHSSNVDFQAGKERSSERKSYSLFNLDQMEKHRRQMSQMEIPTTVPSSNMAKPPGAYGTTIKTTGTFSPKEGREQIDIHKSGQKTIPVANVNPIVHKPTTRAETPNYKTARPSLSITKGVINRPLSFSPPKNTPENLFSQPQGGSESHFRPKNFPHSLSRDVFRPSGREEHIARQKSTTPGDVSSHFMPHTQAFASDRLQYQRSNVAHGSGGQMIEQPMETREKVSESDLNISVRSTPSSLTPNSLDRPSPVTSPQTSACPKKAFMERFMKINTEGEGEDGASPPLPEVKVNVERADTYKTENTALKMEQMDKKCDVDLLKKEAKDVDLISEKSSVTTKQEDVKTPEIIKSETVKEEPAESSGTQTNSPKPDSDTEKEDDYVDDGSETEIYMSQSEDEVQKTQLEYTKTRRSLKNKALRLQGKCEKELLMTKNRRSKQRKNSTVAGNRYLHRKDKKSIKSLGKKGSRESDQNVIRTRSRDSGRNRLLSYNKNAAYEEELHRDECRRMLKKAKRQAILYDCHSFSEDTNDSMYSQKTMDMDADENADDESSSENEQELEEESAGRSPRSRGRTPPRHPGCFTRHSTRLVKRKLRARPSRPMPMGYGDIRERAASRHSKNVTIQQFHEKRKKVLKTRTSLDVKRTIDEDLDGTETGEGVAEGDGTQGVKGRRKYIKRRLELKGLKKNQGVEKGKKRGRKRKNIFPEVNEELRPKDVYMVKKKRKCLKKMLKHSGNPDSDEGNGTQDVTNVKKTVRQYRKSKKNRHLDGLKIQSLDESTDCSNKTKKRFSHFKKKLQVRMTRLNDRFLSSTSNYLMNKESTKGKKKEKRFRFEDKKKHSFKLQTKISSAAEAKETEEEEKEGKEDYIDPDLYYKISKDEMRATQNANLPCSQPNPLESIRLNVCRDTGETVLHKAARLGFEDMVLSILQYPGSDVNIRDNAGYTALHESCVTGHIDIAKHLLAHGADVNAAANEGTRPLHDAVDNNNIEIVRLLLSCGADINLALCKNRSVLRLAKTDAMRSLLKGHLHDLNGPLTNAEGHLLSEDKPWEFYGSSVIEGKPSKLSEGFNPLSDAPSDNDDDMFDLVQFETSEEPHLQTYYLTLDQSKGQINYHLLDDVLGRTGLTLSELQEKHKGLVVVTREFQEILQELKGTITGSTSLSRKCENKNSTVLDFVEIDNTLCSLLDVKVEAIHLPRTASFTNNTTGRKTSTGSKVKVHGLTSATRNGTSTEKVCRSIIDKKERASTRSHSLPDSNHVLDLTKGSVPHSGFSFRAQYLERHLTGRIDNGNNPGYPFPRKTARYNGQAPTSTRVSLPHGISQHDISAASTCTNGDWIRNSAISSQQQRNDQENNRTNDRNAMTRQQNMSLFGAPSSSVTTSKKDFSDHYSRIHLEKKREGHSIGKTAGNYDNVARVNPTVQQQQQQSNFFDVFKNFVAKRNQTPMPNRARPEFRNETSKYHSNQMNAPQKPTDDLGAYHNGYTNAPRYLTSALTEDAQIRPAPTNAKNERFGYPSVSKQYCDSPMTLYDHHHRRNTVAQSQFYGQEVPICAEVNPMCHPNYSQWQTRPNKGEPNLHEKDHEQHEFSTNSQTLSEPRPVYHDLQTVKTRDNALDLVLGNKSSFYESQNMRQTERPPCSCMAVCQDKCERKNNIHDMPGNLSMDSNGKLHSALLLQMLSNSSFPDEKHQIGCPVQAELKRVHENTPAKKTDFANIFYNRKKSHYPDGNHEDNHEMALPVLEKHDLPPSEHVKPIPPETTEEEISEDREMPELTLYAY